MKTYNFSGHLSPLPPGIKLPLQLSGEVCLPSDVAIEVSAIRERHAAELTQLRRQMARLSAQLDGLRRKVRVLKTNDSTPAARRGEG